MCCRVFLFLTMKKVIVIGGGPAGMMAAAAAAGAGHEVLLVEQNEKLGKKLYITGKGRGNFTNAADIEDFFDKTVSNPKFLYSALYGFSNQSLLAFLEEYGLAWKEERGGRIFPASDHASDVTKALTKALQSAGASVRLHTRVTAIVAEEAPAELSDGAKNGEAIRVQGVEAVTAGDGKGGRSGARQADDEKREFLPADHVIVATGGLSYPATGSTGDGFGFAGALGIETKAAYPALVPLEVMEDDIPQMQGLALKNVALKVSDGGKKVFDGFGELLFTHFGVSGPLVLSASSRLTKGLAKGKKYQASIDLKPALEEPVLDERLQRQIAEHRKKDFSHFFEGLVPRKMQAVLGQRSGIAPERKIGSLTREERRQIGALLKDFSFTVTGTRGFSEAIITQGGISVREIDPATMYAKKYKGLSFAGEVLDVDALTGGYNLQIAFSTGYLAGSSIA